ncbi:2-hydroxyacid dehydrogenase [Arcticibacterium luteifluviistationis]|uniref:Glyoxylate/hydroxypyruvate reductase B n=1 Tax=Arcticibacterium luteifluviistationis TaxID=1784714 RepID=A0A2Z4G978_9BACT|nr:D-glycerate dehydrogenase [Arcticibacterium luteifluviistationis]AWV97726.1 D-glycerate dehydrogenase [Arcticibacterium luteifluviistationis]
MKKELSELKILVSRDIPEIGLNLLRQKGCELKVQSSDNPFSPEEFKNASQWADVVLASSKEKITEDFLDANPQLLMLSQYSAGYDNVDVEACNKRKLPVGHTPQAMNRATSDIAFGLMIATARNFFQMHKKLVKGEIEGFKPRANLGQELNGKTLGIFGLGAIGFEMAKKCKMAYDMNIIYCNRSENQNAKMGLNATLVSFDELLKSSDVLSVHSNLSEQTHQIFNADAFTKMKSTSIFINTSRGKVHDETALIQALKNGDIWGAGLDVADPEPMKTDNPLLNMPNVCVLPHIGSATVEARDEMSRLSAENIIQYFEKGKMIHCVNPEVL